jgi:hypothetical protein
MDTIIYILLKTKRSLIRDTKFIGPAPPSYGEREREREREREYSDGHRRVLVPTPLNLGISAFELGWNLSWQGHYNSNFTAP